MGEIVSYTKDGIDALIAGAGSGGITQEDLDAAIAALIDSAPGTLDTLNELAAALADDASFAASMTTALAGKADQVDLDAVIDALAIIGANNQTGTTYTLDLTDAGLVVELNNAAAITLTVPDNATEAFPIGTVIEIWQQGAGQVTIVAASGVTIRSTEGKLKLFGQYSGASLRKRGTDEWVLVGDLVA